MLGLRPVGAAAHGGLRRVLVRRPAWPDPRLRRPLRHHRRRRVPPGRPERAQAGGRRGRAGVPGRGARPRRAPDRSGGRLGRLPATCGGTTWCRRQPETHEAEAFDAEHPLYIMYTSGTTAKPKGILHTSGGYLTHVSATHRLIFDIKPETDVFWTAADIGWVTGHSYIVYGPLANGATSVMYEGTPDTPAPTAGGRSSRSTRSTSSTRRRPPSGPS